MKIRSAKSVHHTKIFIIPKASQESMLFFENNFLITHYALRANHHSKVQKLYTKNVCVTKNQSKSLKYARAIAES